jgi:NadR type nicotinamide-nucleotide adenylyltransferase
VDLIRRYAGDVDVVFTSEDYGDELAARLQARHVCVDRARVVVPVSGTAIRADPAANWIYIPPVVRPAFVQRVAILGAESTGKSTLARQLADIFQTTWVPEYGRTYCEARDPRTLTLEDFDAIGRGQLAMEEAGVMDANKVIFCDTDLHTTCTWSDMIAGSRSPWLDAAARARRYHGTFLLGADVPWVNDGTRVFGERRSEHTRRLRAQLMAARHHFDELHGSFELRTDAAVRLVRALL